MSDRVETIAVREDEDGMRLDRWLRHHFPTLNHSYAQKLIRSGQIRVDSKRVQANARVAAGQNIRVPKVVREPQPGTVNAQTPTTNTADQALIEKLILYEDDDVLVLNKPFGLAVQGGTGTRRHLDGMLAGMSERFGDRPRLVHRLDRDTTGVLLIAKSRRAAAKLGRTFQTRSAAKTYWALVKGIPKPTQGRIEAALVKASGPDGDRMRKAKPGEQERAMHATTHYNIIDRVGQKTAWLSLKPVTGRQHQLRAHMQLIGHPIIGDNKYGAEQEFADVNLPPKLHLHARRLVIPHPIEDQIIDVTAPLPDHMRESFDLLGLDAEKFERHDAQSQKSERAGKTQGRKPARKSARQHRPQKRGAGG